MTLIDFAQKYIKSFYSPISPITGLYPYQIDYLKSLQDNRFTHTTQARQMGITTTLILYAAWQLTHHSNITLGWASNSLENSNNSLTRIKEIINHYINDNDISIIIDRNTKQELTLSNGSRLFSIGSAPDAFRSRSVDIVIIDSAAFIRNLNEIYSVIVSSIPAQPNSSIHMTSTPNGFNFYHRILMEDNMFYKQVIPYYFNEKYGDKWAKSMRSTIGDRIFQQECVAEYLDYERVPSESKIVPVRIDGDTMGLIYQKLIDLDINISTYIRSLIKNNLGI